MCKKTRRKLTKLLFRTYYSLHLTISGQDGGLRAEQIPELKKRLLPREGVLGAVSNKFGKPSSASRKVVESGNIKLADGVSISVEDADKEYVFAVSDKFQIDEIQAFILLRSFLYNQGLPPTSDSNSMVAELVEAIGPFFSSEYLHTFRVMLPLFRANGNAEDALYEISAELLPRAIPDGEKFAESILQEYLLKTQIKLPDIYHGEPKAATSWAKQNLREQLVLLELLFWTMWEYVPCGGPMVLKIFEAAYSTNLGSNQSDNTLLLDDESRQIQQDCAAIWILITIEVLELEAIGEVDGIDLSNSPLHSKLYFSSPESLKSIHDLIINHADSQYSCVYLAWSYVLSRLSAKAADTPDVPASFQVFLDHVNSSAGRSYTKDREPIHTQMAKACLDPDAGLFSLLQNLFTNSPLFVNALYLKTGSALTESNTMAFRSVLKGTFAIINHLLPHSDLSAGFITALIELVPVELVPDFDGLVEVWIALFGRSESASVSGICMQFWLTDWHHGIARRAIFDVARSRFPIQVRPLLRLLRAMTGAGFLDTDPLYTSDIDQERPLTEQRAVCDRFVYHYLSQLSTYSQVIPISACTGAHALYERQTERYGTGNAGLTYVNLRPIRVPGGSTIHARCTGRLLSGDGGDHVVVCWQHQHSGWKVILEILTDYVNRRRMDFGSGGNYQDVSFGARNTAQVKTLRIADVGIEIDAESDEATITDALDLVRSLVQGNPVEAGLLLQSLEDSEPVVCHTMTEAAPPDLVQLTTMVLEEALSRAGTRSRQLLPTRLITSALSVLTALLAIPSHANRVWLYMRSTTALFGAERTQGFAAYALAAERAAGQYTMTLALLQLATALLREATLSILPENAKLQQLKEEVLLRAVRFVHSEIWVEHLGWKYAQLGDRFEIGHRVAALFVSVLQNVPPGGATRPFAALSQAVADILLFKATTSTISPLVAGISSGMQVMRMLFVARRHLDVRRLIMLLQAELHLCHIVLVHKTRSGIAGRACLLEQALCARVIATQVHDGMHTRSDPVDVLASYIPEQALGPLVPMEAAQLLYTLSVSLKASQPAAPTLIGHLSDPEATVASLIRIIHNPYDDLSLRKAIWFFIALSVDNEPALATLFVSGKSRSPAEFDPSKGLEWQNDTKGKKKADEKPKEEENVFNMRPTSALEAARQILVGWKELWEANPLLLACIFRFLDVIWQHALEHKSVVDPLREDDEFWTMVVSIAFEEVGPVPTYETTEITTIEGIRCSTLHEPIQVHAYRTVVKSYATHILTQDVGLHLQLHGTDVPLKKPLSYTKLEPHLKSQEKLADLLAEAAPSSYAPDLHDKGAALLSTYFPGLTLEQLEVQEHVSERDYGDSFAFSASLLRTRLAAYPAALDSMDDPVEEAEKVVLSINLNLSLVHAETALLESWVTLLKQVIPYLRIDAAIRPHLLAIAASTSFDIASEHRGGDMMGTIHGSRLSLVLALLEVSWFSSTDKKAEIGSFMELVHNLRNIVSNEAQSPSRSLLSALPVPFHRVLLQIIYFVAKQGRSLLNRPKTLNAEQRLTFAQTVEATLSFVIDALSTVFMAARARSDIDLDRDMELLVSVFEQCTRPDIDASSTYWLTRCQETNVIRSSLELYTHIDLVGLSDLPLLLSRKQPLYSPHILLFHMALVSNTAAAERIASEGILTAYSSNFISSAISSGMIDVMLPELPTQRSPAHLAYCSMLSIVAMVISTIGKQNHYFDAEAVGFVTLYWPQITRALSWTNADPITLPLLEEIDQVVNLFYALAASVPTSAKSNALVERILSGFTVNALKLLQQVNYAITHPNHLASLYDPVTHDERIRFEKAQSQTDPLKRTFVTHLIHRLFQLSSSLIGTLAAISRADKVLLNGPDDWPVTQAVIIPVRFSLIPIVYMQLSCC